jgi:DNA-binding GntR family transcriptional regulator
LPANLPLRPQALASRLSVSVMPVREALRLLEAEGLVSFTPRRGARVAELSEEDIEETYIVRAALEGLAARLAVQNMTPRDLRALQRTHSRMQRARQEEDLAEFLTSDREFHATMYGLSKREGLVRRILQLWDQSRRYLALTYETANPWDDALASHQAILKACQAHDAAQAERVTREHTQAACDRLLQVLRSRAHRSPNRSAN